MEEKLKDSAAIRDPQQGDDVEVFDLEPAVYKFKLRQKDPATGEISLINCELREIYGDERNKHLASISARNKTGADGQQKFNFEYLHAELLSRCCYKEGEGKPFGMDYIEKNFPASLQARLFKKAQELSGLDPKALERAKNA